ncbi:hypothetical protein [Bacillus dakarensis]|uniref:hypothetical protein n=1 Tax=Robertmurraya dakarensis TaxID=1926278 RepID=UPI0012B69170|nr:hypothetical protein [Bacillus dakarensis]
MRGRRLITSSYSITIRNPYDNNRRIRDEGDARDADGDDHHARGGGVNGHDEMGSRHVRDDVVGGCRIHIVMDNLHTHGVVDNHILVGTDNHNPYLDQNLQSTVFS